LYGEQSAIADKPQAARDQAKSPEKSGAELDYKKLVASLKNRNKAPLITRVSDDARVTFPSTFDWGEQARVLNVIQTLTDNIEHAWPALAEALTERDYCATVRTEFSVIWDYNYSVGSVCQQILVESLARGYMKHVRGSETAWRRLRRPKPLPSGAHELKSWFAAQREKSKQFFELQIEMCEWAIKEIPLLSASDEEKKAWIAGVELQVERLRRLKRPVRLNSFLRGESRRAFGWRKRAEADLAVTINPKSNEMPMRDRGDADAAFRDLLNPRVTIPQGDSAPMIERLPPPRSQP
jgi:hypothetical protein